VGTYHNNLTRLYKLGKQGLILKATFIPSQVFYNILLKELKLFIISHKKGGTYITAKTLV